MHFADPSIKLDTVQVEELHGKPLHFSTLDECFKHIDDNLQELKHTGMLAFPHADSVESIGCVDQQLFDAVTKGGKYK